MQHLADPRQVSFVPDRRTSSVTGIPVVSLQRDGVEVGVQIHDRDTEACAIAQREADGRYRCVDAPDITWPSRCAAIEGLAAYLRRQILGVQLHG